MLAYLFWHRPAPGVDGAEYERRLVGFHARLSREGYTSAARRLEQLPFTERAGYEDWYLVDGWPGLGDLNDAAVDSRLLATHVAVAELAGEGWGGVYRLLRGDPAPPRRARWLGKPRDVSYASFAHQLRATAVWQRQLVLGPAPEFCIEDGEAASCQWLWP